MKNFVVLGKNGAFARSFQNLITEQQLGNCLSIPFRTFRSENLKFTSFLRGEITYVFTFGGKNQIYQISEEEKMLIKLLKNLPISEKARSSLIYLSSGEIYGNNTEPYELSPIDPVSAYGIVKANCERIILENGTKVMKHIEIFRIANAYDCKNVSLLRNLIANIVLQLQKKRKLSITSSLQSRKQYGTFSDYVKFIIEAVSSGTAIETSSDITITNVAPNFSYSIADILGIFEQKFPEAISLKNYFQTPGTGLPLESRELFSLLPTQFHWSRLEDELKQITQI